MDTHRLQALLDLRQDLVPERLALRWAARRVEGLAEPVGAFGWYAKSPLPVHATVRLDRHSVPGGRVWLVLGLDPGQYLPTVSRFTPKRAAISRLECPACMECKDSCRFRPS